MKTLIETVAAALLATIAVVTGCSAPPRGEPVAERPSVTIFPVHVAGEDREDVAALVAMLLEQRGLDTIEVADTVFAPDPAGPVDVQAQNFASFVEQRGLATEYALYGAILGGPSRGAEEIRAVLVDAHGHVAWTDRQTRESPAMRRARPSDPMACTRFLVQRLGDPLALQAPRRTDGRWAAHWRDDALGPDDGERAAMRDRLARLRAAAPAATVLVYPVRTVEGWSAECARRLADEINRRGILHASVSDAPLPFEVRAARNEQRVLWSGARSIRRLVPATAPGTDYVLLADYLVSPRSGEVLGVHTFLLESGGDWVVVDYQNSHHDDFRRITPRSLEDCCTLSVARLERRLGSG